MLGLYNYGARFYSTVLGRFLSPDPLVVAPGDPQMLDRYAYVRNNPLRYVDPTGLHLVIVCGTGQNCQGAPNPRTIESYKLFVQLYWRLHEGVPLGDLGKKWSVFSAYVAYGFSPENQLAAGHVAFLSTAEDWKAALDRGNYPAYETKLRNLVAGHSEIDTVIGFSMGGYITARFLAGGGTGGVQRALLIESAFETLGYPIGNAADVQGVRIVTWNGNNPNAYLRPPGVLGNIPGAIRIGCAGRIPGAQDITTHECGEHCSHGDNALLVGIAMLTLAR